MKKVITGPIKRLNDLSAAEVASMIEADSALSPEGNSEFGSCALDEFLHNATLSRPELLEIRRLILEGMYVPVAGSDHLEVNKEHLLRAAAHLRQGGIF
ncbi:MAG TPA: hypothetical protein VIP30_17350 [Stenotrophomonas sp.]